MPCNSSQFSFIQSWTKLSALGFRRTPLLPPTEAAIKSSLKKTPSELELATVADREAVVATLSVSLAGRGRASTPFESTEMSAWVGYIHPEPMMVMPNNKSLLLYIVQRFKMVNRRYRRLQSFIGNGKREITSSHQPENGLVTDWGRTLASEPKTSSR